MIKRILWVMMVSFMLTCFVGGLCGFTFDKEKKMGYVELRILFDQYEKTQAVDAKITELAAAKQQERDELVEKIRRMKDEMVVLAEKGDEKIKKQAEIDAEIKELQAFDEKSRDELRQIRDEHVKEIFDDLTETIEEYGKKENYDFIFSDRALVYKRNNLNITKVILNNLNKKYQKERK